MKLDNNLWIFLIVRCDVRKLLWSKEFSIRKLTKTIGKNVIQDSISLLFIYVSDYKFWVSYCDQKNYVSIRKNMIQNNDLR